MVRLLIRAALLFCVLVALADAKIGRIAQTSRQVKELNPGPCDELKPGTPYYTCTNNTQCPAWGPGGPFLCKGACDQQAQHDALGLNTPVQRVACSVAHGSEALKAMGQQQRWADAIAKCDVSGKIDRLDSVYSY